MSEATGIGAKIRAHKLVFIIILIVVLAGAGAGGYYGWQQYQYRQTSAFAFEKLKQAIAPADTNALAHMVDFNSLGRDMAKAASQSFPFYMAGDDQERGVNRVLQAALLKRFMEPESKGSMFPEDESPQAQLQKPLELMPLDFISQLQGSLALRDMDPETALVSAKIEHPQLKQTFPLIMEMKKTSQGWRIRHLVNAGEVAAQLREAMLARHAALHDVFVEKNTATAKKMNETIPLQSCEANAGLLSDGKTAIMIVRAVAPNKSDIQVNNFNLDATITGRSGRALVRRYLNAAKPVAPGENFDHRWSFELDPDSPLTRALLSEGPLRCSGTWQTLSLNNGQVLHIVEEPNPEVNCDKPGHNHPQGFCLSPVFQQ